jgi:glyoxylase-like metal-dependent hydrolase (beta-lactamase superfamily II)
VITRASYKHRALAWPVLPVAILASLGAGSAVAQEAPGHSPPPGPATAAVPGALRAWPVQGRVYVIAGAGQNVVVQVGDAGIELVNAGAAGTTPAVLAAIRQLSDKPIQFIIATSADLDAVGGAFELAKAGHMNTGQPGEPAGAGMVSQLNVLTRLTNENNPGVKLPTDAYEDGWSFFNDEAVVLTHAPAAHSDGDTWVFFRRSDVIVTAPFFEPGRYPVIDSAHGGSMTGTLNVLNDLIALMVPRENEEGGTYVVPARGRICDHTDIVNYRDALTIIRDRVAYYAGKGMSLEQVLAAKPSADYDGIYGAEEGPWTTRMFLEAVYKDVKAAAGRKQAPRASTGEAK